MTPEEKDRTFKISLVLALVFLTVGAFFTWRLTQFSPAEVEQAVHLQREGDAWRQLEKQMKSAHTKADEIALLQSYLRQYPPASPPTKREAQALDALKKRGAEPPTP